MTPEWKEGWDAWPDTSLCENPYDRDPKKYDDWDRAWKARHYAHYREQSLKGKLSDLKLIDELLVLLKPPGWSWERFDEDYGSVVTEAMERLRRAKETGEMAYLTLSIYNYFESQKGKAV